MRTYDHERGEDEMDERYALYLRSFEWDMRRLERLEYDGYECQGCGAVDEELQVHHKTYDRIYEEDLHDLVTLCVGCHEEADMERRAKKRRDMWYRRLNGWANKVYGEDWDIYPGYEVAEDAFTRWLERKGEY